MQEMSTSELSDTEADTNDTPEPSEPPKARRTRNSNPSPVKKILRARVGIHENMGTHQKTIGIRKCTGLQDARGDVTELTARETDPHFVHVDYPGIVENPTNALRTLGGSIKLSEVFNNPSKRLELRYRPADPFCNALHGVGRTTTGLLIKVRRRKRNPLFAKAPVRPEVTKSAMIDLDKDSQDLPDILRQLREEAKITPGKHSNDDNKSDADGAGESSKIVGSGDETVEEESSYEADTPFIRKLLKDEEELQRDIRIQDEDNNHDFLENEGNDFLGNIKTVVKLPKGKFNPPKSNFQLQCVGVVTKTYDFTGMSDYQFLPTVAADDGKQVSICDNIFPGFGKPEEEHLFDYENPEDNSGKKYFTFSLPSYLSRIDKPITHMPKSYYADDGSIISNENETGRGRRSVYTKMVNFNERDSEVSEEVQVPTEPYVQALEDAAKKFFDRKQLDLMKKLFNDRPIWTKSALQTETKYSNESLKYLLPCVAYFTLNGPWRSLWIRMGYDPRKDKTAFVYQLVDFRFPIEYRCHMEIDRDDKENYHKFKPNKIPPKSQMFYQLCEIKIPEIEELQGALTVRLNTAEDLVCDSKHGYLDENVMEFCRYCMSRCIEVRLCDLGKIQSVRLPPLKLEPGGLIPVHQLKIKNKKNAKKKIKANFGVKNKQRKSNVPEIAAVTYETPNEQDNSSAAQNLTDFFDDDEEMEEEDVEPYDGHDFEGKGTSVKKHKDVFTYDEEDADEA